MADTHQGGSEQDFDLTQFYQIFFEEAAENLDQMEQMLLNLDLNEANDEELNGIFRCAHSIKGGSATFGFSDVAELTHKMESLLDRLRRHEITPIPEMVDVLLESADASRSLLARHQAGGEGEVLPTADLVARISRLAAGEGGAAVDAVSAPVPAPAAATPASTVAQDPVPAVVAAPAAPVAVGGLRHLQIKIDSLDVPESVDAIKELFRDIPGLGSIEDLPCDEPKTRLFAVKTHSTDDDLLDLMAFHVAKSMCKLPRRMLLHRQPVLRPAFRRLLPSPQTNLRGNPHCCRQRRARLTVFLRGPPAPPLTSLLQRRLRRPHALIWRRWSRPAFVSM